jgi:hypothetical protein
VTDPYRTSAPRSESDEEAEAADDLSALGAVRSTHRRSGVAATLGRTFVLTVHADGLVITEGDAEDTPPLVLRFDAIDALYFDFDRLLDGPPLVTLTTFDGMRRALPSDLTEPELVLGALARRVTLPLSREAEEAFRRGDRLAFGPIVLHRNGLKLNAEQFVAWDDLVEVHVDRQVVVVHAAEPRFRVGWVKLKEIPHPSILLDLLRIRTNVVLDGLKL